MGIAELSQSGPLLRRRISNSCHPSAYPVYLQFDNAAELIAPFWGIGLACVLVCPRGLGHSDEDVLHSTDRRGVRGHRGRELLEGHGVRVLENGTAFTST